MIMIMMMISIWCAVSFGSSIATRAIVSEKEETETTPTPAYPAFISSVDWSQLLTQWLTCGQVTYINLAAIVKEWVVLMYYASIPLVLFLQFVMEILTPHLQDQMWTGWAFIRRQPPQVLLQTLCGLGLVGVGWYKGFFGVVWHTVVRTREGISSSYRQLRLELARKSQFAATLLPHVSFLVIIVVLKWTLPSFVWDGVWGNDVVELALSVWYPVVQSLRTLIQDKQQKKHKPHGRARTTIMFWLEYWMVWNAWTASLTLARMFLIFGLDEILSLSPQWMITTLLWIHCPWTKGLHGFIYPQFIQLMPSVLFVKNDTEKKGSESESKQDDTGMMIKSLKLVSSSFMSNQMIESGFQLIEQGPALVGLVFLFTPGFITRYGALVVGSILPIRFTLAATGQAPNLCWWLVYFTMYAIFGYIWDQLMVSIGWLPLFHHVGLVVMLWLQFPYFRGAQVCFDVLFQLFCTRSTTTKSSSGRAKED